MRIRDWSSDVCSSDLFCVLSPTDADAVDFIESFSRRTSAPNRVVLAPTRWSRPAARPTSVLRPLKSQHQSGGNPLIEHKNDRRLDADRDARTFSNYLAIRAPRPEPAPLNL